MAAGVPPPPLNSPSGSFYWLEWYTSLTGFLNGTNIPWANLNFAGSNITDILVRNHNDLQNIQGGSGAGILTGQHWHMSGRAQVTAAGAATGLPSGWSCSRISAGVYNIIHTLGTAFPLVGAVATSNTTGVIVLSIDCSAINLIVVHTTNIGGSSTDGNFTLIVNS